MRVGIVLAAGASRRMGEPKLELHLGGRSVLERAVENLLEAGLERVRVVVAPGGERALGNVDRGRVEAHTNPRSELGVSSSLRVALDGIPESTDAIVITLGDVPFVRPETIRAVIDAFEAPEVQAAYPVYQGAQGHPVVFEGALVPELSALGSDRGAKSLLGRLGPRARAVSVDDPGVCFDIDTPEDYARARERLREENGFS